MADTEYILGTEKEEIHRLGIQHQVWSSEARKGWEIAEFASGQRILDLACGPGFSTMELAYLVGESGSVTGVDLSPVFIQFLKAQAELHGLSIEGIASSFEEMELRDSYYDGVNCRWGLPWVKNPEEIIKKVVKSMAPGGVFVSHEYYHWQTFTMEPHFPGLSHGLQKAFDSMNEYGAGMDIGRRLPAIFERAGLDVISVRPMNKLALPEESTWDWPKSFFEIYFPKLVPEFLSEEELDEALGDFYDLENTPGASILCPSMVEVVAAKPYTI